MVVVWLFSFRYRLHGRFSFDKCRLDDSIHENTRELWIDCSGMLRAPRLVNQFSLSDEIVLFDWMERNALAYDEFVWLQQLSVKSVRIYTLSGDRVAWLIYALSFSNTVSVIIDVYDPRNNDDYWYRRALESMAVDRSDWIQCRDLRSHGGRTSNGVVRGKRFLVLDPPLDIGCCAPAKSKKILAAGWISGPGKYGYSYETFKILLEKGFELTVFPGTTQRWTDANLSSYVELSKEFPQLHLRDPVTATELVSEYKKHSHGLFVSDFDWKEGVPSAPPIFKHSYARDSASRLSDYIGFGMIVICSNRKKFGKFLAARYGLLQPVIFEEMISKSTAQSDSAWIDLKKPDRRVKFLKKIETSLKLNR